MEKEILTYGDIEIQIKKKNFFFTARRLYSFKRCRY